MKFISLFFFLCIAVQLRAQCPTSNLHFTTQAEVDAFPSLYPDCDSLLSNLRIGWTGGAQTDIDNLDSLIQLKYANQLFITDNPFTDFSGLDSLKEVNYFILARCLVTDFNGLGNVEYIRTFQIADNDNMINAEGLDKLQSIYSMSFDGHSQLENFEGLENVDVKSLELYNNTSLVSLEGLSSTDTLRNIRIVNNDMLTDLNGLENLDKINEDIQFKGNASLSSCSIEALCNQIFESDNNIEIVNNGVNCNSIQEVIENCLGSSDYWLKTQSDVDNFKLNNGCIEEVETLIIGNPFATANLTSNIKLLDSLECLEHITEHLVIENNDSIPSLEGLNNLTSVGKSFRFIRNERIKNLLPINQLESVGGPMKFIENDSLLTTSGLEEITETSDIFMQYNDFLVDINGFTNIETIQGSIFMEGMNDLDLVTGFESLEMIQGDFRIEDCFGINSFASLTGLDYIGADLYLYYIGITNFQGMNNLDSIGGDFELEELENLVNMQGLESLKKVNGGFEIYYCYYELLNFNGLENLEYIGDRLYLEENYYLNDITALSNVEEIGGDAIYIDESESLAFCAIPAICNFINDPTKESNLAGNLAGCNTIEEILEDCESCPTCALHRTNTWLSSAVDSDWNNPINWSLGIIPNECQYVIIPPGESISISDNTATCYRLTLENGAQVTASEDVSIGCIE